MATEPEEPGQAAAKVRMQGEMAAGALSGFFLSILGPQPGMLLSTNRVGLLSSIKPFWKHPHPHLHPHTLTLTQRSTSWVTVLLVKLTLKV